MYSFQMDKDRFAVSRGACSWLEMHQFIGDLMTSSSAQPVKDSAQQEALRVAWETAGHEALGLRIAPAAPQAQNRQPHSKGASGCSLQPLPEPVERSVEAASSGQQFQHRTCTCPACPFSSSFSSSSPATFQALRPRESPPSQTISTQVDQVRQAKESSAVPVSLGLCLGLGLSLEEEAGEQIRSCGIEADVQQQQQQQQGQNSDRAVSSRNPNASPHAPPQMPTFPCLCCHRGFQTCAQLLRHQQGSEPHFPHPHHRYHHHHHHHHHCPLASCLPCPQLAHPPQSPPPFPCLSCQRTFQTCAQLLRHQQGHVQPEGVSQHPCMHCPASFPRPSQLLQHQRSQHASKTGGFLCPECGRAFNSHSNLRIHLNVHTGARPYSCADCGKSFSQSGALKIHRRIHTGERPYTCDFCGRGFPHLAGVRAHQRTHTGEKPYRCPQCGKCFTQSGALKIHLRIHTGERPFVCGLCGKGFSNRAGIRFHHRTAHGVVSEASLGLAAAAGSAHPGLGLLASAVADPGLALAVSPATSPSPDAGGSPAGNGGADAGRPGSSLASGTVSSSLSSPSSTFSPDAAPVPSKGAPRRSAAAGRDRKQLVYACEDCGLRFRDALSRNKHQELEHYPDPEDEGEEEGEEEGVELSPEKEGGMGETVESMIQ
ncbi:zinc finger protein 696 [Anguilla anguilla]|uniref:zinc finger protein 696 n=1 Tax=Anguilla anguilla TaxID=7936 RepID=UPI0015A8B975|nr:zinc finger protein 696 [Anguilla anguilla]